jgi:hypothetical protein
MLWIYYTLFEPYLPINMYMITSLKLVESGFGIKTDWEVVDENA